MDYIKIDTYNCCTITGIGDDQKYRKAEYIELYIGGQYIHLRMSHADFKKLLSNTDLRDCNDETNYCNLDFAVRQRAEMAAKKKKPRK